MDETQQLREAIRCLAVEDRVSCRDLLDLARRLGVEAAALGQLCNEMRIKITDCRLGCFK